jgi:hypothetical protein
MKTIVTLLLVLIFPKISFAASMLTFSRPDYNQVNAMGFDGVNVVGFHESNQGFIYNTLTDTWSDFSPPETINSRPWGVDGNMVAGMYNNNNSGFYHDITTSTFTDMKLSGLYTQPRDVSSTIIVGSVGGGFSFIFDTLVSDPNDNNTYQTIQHPSGQTTRAWGVDGNLVVGEYGLSGFVYNMNTGTWNDIMRSGSSRTNVQGISGNLVSGFYTDSLDGKTRGFVYDLVNQEWTDIPNPDPLSSFMQARSIENDVIVGSFRPMGGSGDVGFIYTIPEPSTSLMMGLILLIASLRKRR